MNYRYGKVVLVVGASSGIGKAIAMRLKDEGYHVYGTSRKEQQQPLEVGFEGGFLKMMRLDVKIPEQAEAAVEAVVKGEGQLDILINCAGMGIAGSIEDTEDEEAALQMHTNRCV